MGQNAAFQKRLELIFDKLGQACPSFLFDLGKEGFDVVLDDLVERGLLGPAAFVGNRRVIGGRREIATLGSARPCADGIVVPVTAIGIVRVPWAQAG